MIRWLTHTVAFLFAFIAIGGLVRGVVVGPLFFLLISLVVACVSIGEIGGEHRRVVLLERQRLARERSRFEAQTEATQRQVRVYALALTAEQAPSKPAEPLGTFNNPFPPPFEVWKPCPHCGDYNAHVLEAVRPDSPAGAVRFRECLECDWSWFDSA